MDFGWGWLNNGRSGGGSTIAAQMASARGLRSWRGGDRIGLASSTGGVSGTLGERPCDAVCILEGNSGAIAIAGGGGGGSGGEAGSGSRMVRTMDCGTLGLRVGVTVEPPEL